MWSSNHDRSWNSKNASPLPANSSTDPNKPAPSVHVSSPSGVLRRSRKSPGELSVTPPQEHERPFLESGDAHRHNRLREER